MNQKKLSKIIKDEIEKHPESIKVLNSIKNNVPKTYFKTDEEKFYKLDDISEIILSEFLISGDN